MSQKFLILALFFCGSLQLVNSESEDEELPEFGDDDSDLQEETPQSPQSAPSSDDSEDEVVATLLSSFPSGGF